ncbi:MAG: hypothetical protein P4L79_10680 [Legionella sp.]|uniref:hypothetical protein n=1 Tax=Legionella sp. TaxID=459 RepID=UPI002851D4C4|nr:hypothetical protein [Legionella sp.]
MFGFCEPVKSGLSDILAQMFEADALKAGEEYFGNTYFSASDQRLNGKYFAVMYSTSKKELTIWYYESTIEFVLTNGEAKYVKPFWKDSYKRLRGDSAKYKERNQAVEILKTWLLTQEKENQNKS